MSPKAPMDPLHDTFGKRRSIQCSHCKAYQALQTYREHRKAPDSTRRSFCRNHFDLDVCSTTHKISSLDRLVRECIDMTRAHKQGKLIQYSPGWQKKEIVSKIFFSSLIFQTYSHVANELLIANGFVGLVNRRRTSWHPTITKTGITTAVIISTLFSILQCAIRRAARTLRWTTRCPANENDEIFQMEPD